MTDPRRGDRTGVPEAVFAQGKSDESLVTAVRDLLEHHPVLVTKTSPEQLLLLQKEFDDIAINEEACAARIGGLWAKGVGRCAVITAGSSDIPIGEEAAFSLEYLGIEPIKAYDRGVAGMHRVEDTLEMLNENRNMGAIVVAGMEGALPSVVASRISQPVIAVPTSIGYGSSFEGLSALLGMLNSCVPGITVANIDNGFGAAVAVYRGIKTWEK